MSSTSRPARIDAIVRSCSRWRRPMPKRCRAICRTVSGPGRWSAASYPDSRVATFRIPQATEASCPGSPANWRPARRRVSCFVAPRGAGDPAVATDGTPSPSEVLLPHRPGEIHRGAGHEEVGGRSPATVPVEAGVTFATHPEDGGFVVDRLRGGEAGVLSPPGWLRTPNAPTF